jgi:flavin-dependent dehydrogenase
MGTKAVSLVIENGFMKGIVVKNDMGDLEKISAKIVVDAEGVSSRILRQAGLTSLNRNAIVNGVQAEVENVDGMDTNMVEVFLDKEFAPGFYAWLVPKRDGTAKVGLAAKNGNPKELLKKFMLKNPAASQKLQNAGIRQIAFHPLTLGGPIMQNYSNGFLAVGDAASQVKPTTGGGVIFGMTCARIAAKVAHEALARNDFSSDFLSGYQKRCREVLGFDMSVMLRLRRIFDGISDEKIDSIISFFSKIRLGETLQGFDDIDSQGQSLLRLLRRPKMLVALFYFFSTFLSANP